MSSKMMMFRSSIRSLIQTSIRPATAAAATMMISTQPPASIYTRLNAITMRPPVIFHIGFCSNAAAGAEDGGGNIDLSDVKNEDYDSDEMGFVFEGADDDDDDDEDVANDDDDDDEIISSDYSDDSDEYDDRGKRYPSSDDD